MAAWCCCQMSGHKVASEKDWQVYWWGGDKLTENCQSAAQPQLMCSATEQLSDSTVAEVDRWRVEGMTEVEMKKVKEGVIFVKHPSMLLWGKRRGGGCLEFNPADTGAISRVHPETDQSVTAEILTLRLLGNFNPLN